MPRTIILLLLFLALPLSAQESLSLSEALNRALRNNYGLIIGRTNVDIASINNNWGAAGRIPTIGFDAAQTNGFDLLNESYSNRLTAGVGLNWTLFDGFRVKWTKTRLEQLQELSEGQLAVLVESTIEDIILAYNGVLVHQELLEVLETVQELSRDRYDYELEKKALGGSVTYNVLQAQNTFLTDKSNYMNQEVVLRNAIRNLNFLMGEDPLLNWTFTENFEADTSTYVLADLLAKMKSSNQSLKNQYTNLHLQESQTSISRSAYSPSLSLGAGIDLSESWTAQTGNPTANNGSLSPYGSLRLSYDIYSAGVRRRTVEVARLNEDLARVKIQEMEHALSNELFNLYDFHQVRIELLKLANENLEAARLNLDISEEKYRSGVINSFNYRDIQLIYLNTAYSQLQAVYDLISSRTSLTRITGGFLNQDVQQ